MKKEVRKNICIKVFFMAFIFPFIQSCTTDNNALTSENICMAIISGAGTAPPIPKLPEDRVVLIDSIIETNYPAFTVPRGFKCRNNREINDTHTNLTTSIYCSKPSSITSPVESKRTELRALR